MATIWPDFRYPIMPSQASARTLRSMSGSTVSGMANITNHLLGVRCRRAVHKRFDWSVDPDGSGNYAYLNWQTLPASATHRIWWKSHELAQYVIVVIQYMTGLSGLTPGTNLRIGATLSVKGGAIVDGLDGANEGVEWSFDGGTLAVSQFIEAARLPDGTISGVLNSETQVATTGSTPVTNLAAGGTYPTTPRPLIVGASNAGQWLELKLVTEYVRIIAVDVWERQDDTVTL